MFAQRPVKFSTTPSPGGKENQLTLLTAPALEFRATRQFRPNIEPEFSSSRTDKGGSFHRFYSFASVRGADRATIDEKRPKLSAANRVYAMSLRVFLSTAVALAGQASWGEDALDQRAATINSQPLSSELTDEGWQLLGLNDVPATEFGRTAEGIRVAANASNALIYRELGDQEANNRYLRWSWRVDSQPNSQTLRKVGNDDRAIALYVAFEINQRHLSLWGRIRSSVVALFSGLPKGQILTYVWGKDDPTNDWFPNPYIRRIGRMKVLRNAMSPLNEWLPEEIDLTSDFKEAFGYEPIRPVYIALSADTEDSGESSLSWVSDIVFSNE